MTSIQSLSHLSPRVPCFSVSVLSLVFFLSLEILGSCQRQRGRRFNETEKRKLAGVRFLGTFQSSELNEFKVRRLRVGSVLRFAD